MTSPIISLGKKNAEWEIIIPFPRDTNQFGE